VIIQKDMKKIVYILLAAILLSNTDVIIASPDTSASFIEYRGPKKSSKSKKFKAKKALKSTKGGRVGKHKDPTYR
jgi:hypothetical protein